MRIARRLPFPSENSANPFTLSKRAITEISSLVRGSNVYWRGKSFAASVPSDVAEFQKGQKKVSKDERKAMVESFIDKYRAMNAGKFPTVSATRKEVGGSYYVIKKIVQEIEYNSKTTEYKSKTTSKNMRNGNILEKEVATANESSTIAEEVSSSQPRMNAEIHKDAHTVEVNEAFIADSSLKNVGAREEPETATPSEKLLSGEVVKLKTDGNCSTYVVIRSDMTKGEADVFHPGPKKHDVEEWSPSEGALDLDGSKSKDNEHQQSLELDKCEMDLSGRQTNDQELPKESSMWQNLKSLADGFFNMWKKS